MNDTNNDVRKSNGNEKHYVQFSKKVVVAVTSAVSVLCYLAIILMFAVGQTEYMADVLKMYIAYAMVVFASYSGNSIAEKVIAHNEMNRMLGKISDAVGSDDTAQNG